MEDNWSIKNCGRTNVGSQIIFNLLQCFTYHCYILFISIFIVNYGTFQNVRCPDIHYLVSTDINFCKFGPFMAAFCYSLVYCDIMCLSQGKLFVCHKLKSKWQSFFCGFKIVSVSVDTIWDELSFLWLFSSHGAVIHNFS